MATSLIMRMKEFLNKDDIVVALQEYRDDHLGHGIFCVNVNHLCDDAQIDELDADELILIFDALREIDGAVYMDFIKEAAPIGIQVMQLFDIGFKEHIFFFKMYDSDTWISSFDEAEEDATASEDAQE